MQIHKFSHIYYVIIHTAYLCLHLDGKIGSSVSKEMEMKTKRNSLTVIAANFATVLTKLC